MASGGLKKEIGVDHDALRFGVNAGVKADLVPVHPLQTTLQSVNQRSPFSCFRSVPSKP
jgi:proteasome maturation protein